MIRSTFSSFYMANSALNASQRGLDVTGQNISNANTRGYSRQRIDFVSISASGYNQKYSSAYPNAGSGVRVGSISQTRDPYLDARFRAEQSDYYSTGGKLDALKNLENILNDVSAKGMSGQMDDLLSKLQSLSLDPSSPEFNMLFASSASEFCSMLNNYASQINGARDLTINSFKDGDINAINNLLENISLINKQITQNQLNNTSINELLDHRNLMLDELSTYMKIETSHSSKELSNGVVLDKLSVNLIAPDGSKINLVADDSFNNLQFSYDKTTQTANISLVDGNKNIIVPNLENKIGSGSIKGFLDALHGEGSFGNPASDVKGIKYFEKMIDSFAQTFAQAFNDANALGDGTQRPIFANSADPSNLNPNNITAKNITIASGFKDNSYGVTASNSSESNDNILNMISIFKKDFNFQTGAGASIYKGSLSSYFTFTTTSLANEISNGDKLLETREAVLEGIDLERASMSSVSLDEEAMNMMVFQKSYNAAARYMTALDEALNTIISGMGLVGR